MDKTYVLSYNHGPWSIQVAVAQDESPEAIAEKLHGIVYFNMDGHARMKFSRHTFARMPIPSTIIHHVLEVDDSMTTEFPSEIRLNVTELPLLSL